MVNWTHKQYIEIIHLLFIIENTFVNLRNKNQILLKTISIKWNLKINKIINAKKYKQVYLCQVAFIFALYSN